ncbi:hypothetical protein QBC47DRAFT_395926 [Echria macrotheca]|uniref:Hemerythrin-like domain-containing protein n=1 Tax=Echria macrotheca TaxID=438768 RepID=A0AAJ0B2V8_9PEZI|nr:hypothetical protein QBC47DRAFT_395926 [Echria macrotheca]
MDNKLDSAQGEYLPPVGGGEVERIDGVEGTKQTKSAAASVPVGPELPPLTADQFRVYNRLAVQMEYFHDHFRKTWTTLHTAATTRRLPPRLTTRTLLDEGLHLVRYLTAHHDIEESYLYPILARKMPQFRDAVSSPSSKHNKKKGTECELIRQHRMIHEGMDDFEAYLRACKDKTEEFDFDVLREKMDTWGEVLLKHLDEEVKELGAETMRRYWTVDEMRSIPI